MSLSVVRASRRAGLLLSVLVVAACGSAAPTLAPTTTPALPVTPAPSATFAPGTGDVALAGTSWLLVGYTSPDGKHFTVPMAITPTLVFGPELAQGNAGCNVFGSPWTLEGDVLDFPGPLDSTAMACEEPGSTVEKAYLANLALVDRVALDGENLVMTQSDGMAALEFVPAGI